jgi:hypothetical protein
MGHFLAPRKPLKLPHYKFCPRKEKHNLPHSQNQRYINSYACIRHTVKKSHVGMGQRTWELEFSNPHVVWFAPPLSTLEFCEAFLQCRKGLYQQACQEEWKKCKRKKNSDDEVMYICVSMCVI